MTADADRAAREVLAVDPGRKWTLVLAIVRLTAERDRLAAEVLRLRETLERAQYVARNLLGMIPREVWRDSGGDDEQGHFEGDYRAEQLATEIDGWTES